MVTKYCRQLKKIADRLCTLDEPISDRTLVLNLLRGLNERRSHPRPLIVRTRLFPTFQKVRNDLPLEEITASVVGHSSAALALFSFTHPRHHRMLLPRRHSLRTSG